MKKLFFIYLHLFAPDLLCCWLRVVTTTKEKTGPTGDEGKEIYSLSVTPDKLEFQSTKQTVEVTVTTNGPLLGVYG